MSLSSENECNQRVKQNEVELQKKPPYIRSIAEAYEKKWADCPCLFVLSTGRVGTKTLSALLALSPEVHSYHEPLPRLIKASYDVYMDEGISSEAASNILYAARDDRICQALYNGQIYTETNNRMTYFAPILAQAFPASKFIHLYRHPYDVIRSGMRRKYYLSHKWDFARISPRKGSPFARDWQRRSPLEKTTWFWAEVNQFAIDFLKTLPENRKLSLKSEKLFAGETQTIKDLYTFLETPIPDPEQIEKVLEQKLNAQPKEEGRILVEWEKRDLKKINRQIRNLADCFGYRLE